MKKLKFLAVAVVAAGAALSLASCSSVNQGYADKVNETYQDKKAESKYTYEKVKKDLGKECVDVTAEVLGKHTGFLYAVKGCKTWDDIQKKIDAGDTVEGLTITITGDVAVAASYGKITGKK